EKPGLIYVIGFGLSIFIVIKSLLNRVQGVLENSFAVEVDFCVKNYNFLKRADLGSIPFTFFQPLITLSPLMNGLSKMVSVVVFGGLKNESTGR
ncbi:MAG: hypothetical protein KAG92_04785, partial [Deltaproteobacteria bacterium]|nr:hypothetical protein [Deltaproteobacteria bacterium]